MTFSLEERIFLVLEFHWLEQSVAATKSFTSKFQVAKGPKPNRSTVFYEKFQRIGSVVDGKINTVG